MKMGFRASSLSWLIMRGSFGLFLEPKGLSRVLFDGGKFWLKEDPISIWKVLSLEEENEATNNGVTILGSTMVEGEKDV